ncbi:MAG: ATP-binding protein [Bacteroidaceae bacterium]|nr:ATP-binding protein [Bacteroidaceae bacterium]
MKSFSSKTIALLAIRHTPRRFESVLDETLVLKNNIQEVSRLSSFQKAFFEKMEIEKSLARQIRLAVEEAVVNVIEYAYPAGVEGNVEVRMQTDGRRLRVVIVDSGVPFDPTQKEGIDTSLTAEERQVGGLGIHLLREIMDSVNYEYINGRNTLTLIKKTKE